MKRRLPVMLLCLVFLGIAAFSGYKIITIMNEYKAGEEAYEQLQQFVNIPEPTQRQEEAPDETIRPESNQEPENVESEDPEQTVPEVSVVPVEKNTESAVDFDALHAINEDVVGWIYQEGTAVNYPVAQGEDNQEYLYWLINGDYNGAGTPFVDYRNKPDFSDRNTVIYGHNMNNGTMFADFHKYIDQEYYDTYPTMMLMTPKGDYTVEFFSGYISTLDTNAWQMHFNSDEEYSAWLETAMERSAFESEVVPTVEDRVITISTCSDSAAKTRFVLLGVLR